MKIMYKGYEIEVHYKTTIQNVTMDFSCSLEDFKLIIDKLLFETLVSDQIEELEKQFNVKVLFDFERQEYVYKRFDSEIEYLTSCNSIEELKILLNN